MEGGVGIFGFHISMFVPCCWFVCIQSWIDDALGARVDLVGSRYARMIVTLVLIIWKGLRCFTGTKSLVVVVMSGEYGA